MTLAIDPTRIVVTRDAIAERLLAERRVDDVWEGELSSSALSTATAVTAFALAASESHGRTGDAERVRDGLGWLVKNQNEDGGWGDTIDSPSNVSTTALAWAALNVDRRLRGAYSEELALAERRLRREVGELTPANLTRAITDVYGDDRTFAVPSLTMCALSGVFGEGKEVWRSIPAIPFELAALPHKLYNKLGLPMVSYAMPALIAIGQVIHAHCPTRNPILRALRDGTRSRTLRVLEAIQPSTGGFLEAAPLTSFVAMSLIGCGLGDHIVTEDALEFLRRSVRADGSWPIDTNLTTWLTSLSIDALGGGERLKRYLDEGQRFRTENWLLDQQYTCEHPYTHAAPGGWAWTDLAGGVPDSDDTSAALLALRHLGCDKLHRVASGVRWLVDLQNRDGGIPTFCRGFGRLPFDQSSPDLTAHALRAWASWRDSLAEDLCSRVDRSHDRALRYLLRTQRSDGSWAALWFGNQQNPGLQNPVYGTSRVLKAVGVSDGVEWQGAVKRAARWLLYTQSLEGGWGGAESLRPTIEETALAVDGLCAYAQHTGGNSDVTTSIAYGAAWLAEVTEEGTSFPAAPIGLYFAKLWYCEKLYPLIFATAALEKALPYCHVEWTKV